MITHVLQLVVFFSCQAISLLTYYPRKDYGTNFIFIASCLGNFTSSLTQADIFFVYSISRLVKNFCCLEHETHITSAVCIKTKSGLHRTFPSIKAGGRYSRATPGRLLFLLTKFVIDLTRERLF